MNIPWRYFFAFFGAAVWGFVGAAWDPHPAHRDDPMRVAFNTGAVALCVLWIIDFVRAWRQSAKSRSERDGTP